MRLQTEYLVERYQENIFRAAFSIVKNCADAEDMVQDTFLQYLRSDREFDSEEHIKAWLLRTAINKAKNLRMAFWHRNKVSLEDYLATIPFENPMDHELIDAVLSLPQKYRLVVHLYYYEDYSVREIAAVLTLSESAVKNRLLRGRQMLKNMLKEEWNDDE